MNLTDFIVLAVIAVILIAVSLYIHKEKKKGVQCIGCPDSKTCAGSCGSCSGNCGGCGNHSQQG